MESNFFLEAIIYLLAAVVFVPIAKKIGLSSILGYLFAGIAIGPSVFELIGQKGSDIMHFAEFGVVMMLFLIGLELDPYKFWRMRKFIAGMGSLQVIGTAILLFFGLQLILGWNWQISLTIALALSLSSTAIVLQTLKEKGLNNTSMGRSSFAVLLYQDIAVIPILAIIPLMVSEASDMNINQIAPSLISDFPAWIQTLVVTTAITAIYFSGRFVIVPLLRMVAKTRLQELFTASALLVVFAVSYLMQLVGLSPALGAFMAGVVLANSEFKHELEGDIAPFKGLLLGLFFIGVGASIDFDLIINNPIFIFAFVVALTSLKFLVLFGIGKVYGKNVDQNLQFSLGLSQAGEFGFVIMGFAMGLGIVPTALANQILAIIALSMLLTPFLTALNENYILPFVGTKETVSKDDVTIEETNAVIIAGFGHFGSTIGRMLRANKIEVTVLDHDAERVETLRKMGFNVYYGDATRLSLLKAAGAEEAKLFIAAIDNPEINLQLIVLLRKHFPHLKILARARNRNDAFELIDHGVANFYRETLYTAVHMGVDALVQLGFRKYTATRQGQQFIKYDQDTTLRLATKRHDKMAYMVTVQEEVALQEELLRRDLYAQNEGSDHSWDSEHLKKDVRDSTKP
ncbi:monovalent cation:proton antiporter-2 (CPA2) family protein [Arenibacter sp. GZD96]|uniref:monovalent cation:proton antiporter-2 (CPA2) family protein n=1 Tax=Aurantibrevibacter litoralis TaxID=3106030 RepID=UPI002AFF5DE7|nr:monovalent cation:proton antiporter-2 (CPA2) family protein [Arenibacter sp. GZD-96]MEA1787415.1 monovalent cation:proton antiporter-2 (CPA2) family protein [Arenibacter sp. GZD-96]